MATITGAVLEVGGGYRAVQGTITTDLQQYYGSVTWNAGGVTFTAMLLDITDTASAAASLLMNLKVGGNSKFKVDKTGGVTVNAGTITTDLQQYSASVTWNNAAIAFTAFLLDVTNTASAAGALLANIKLGGVSTWSLNKNGGTTQNGPATIGGLIDITAPSAGKIQFPAAQAASADVNTLDDYEEGTWTPAATLGGGSTGMTFSTQVGQYVKIGKQVTVRCLLLFSAKGSSTGNLVITGLPFASDATANSFASVAVRGSTLASVSDHLQGIVNVGATTINIEQCVAGTNSQLTDTNLNNTSSFILSATYFV